MSDRLRRKLAAILYADVAGYSRLTGADEDGTHRVLRSYLAFVSESIEAHQGRVVHYAGDAVLADFNTVIDAVTCARDIQQELKTRNQGLPEDRWVQFRIGVNLGDVIVDANEIYGEGVNVAARLQTLAQPGGICISESVRTALGNKLQVTYRDLGERSVKNIAEPVRAWHLGDAPASAAGASAWGKAALEPLYVPTIAVLPFENLSGDAETTNFAEGITEEIITAFSRLTGIKVLSRRSTLPLKEKTEAVTELGQKLGAHYILEGSVRKAADRVRIAARLMDAESGNDLWGEQYDGEVSDVFTLQDELRLGIVAATRSQIHLKDARRVRQLPETELTDGELLSLASRHMQMLGLEHCREAARLAGLVTERSPDNPMALAMAASSVLLINEYDYQPVAPPDADWAFELIDKAIRLNEESDYAHYVRGQLLLRIRNQHDLAIAEAERALELNPNYTYGFALLGFATSCRGDPDLGISMIEKALRADPRRAGGVDFYHHIALGHFIAERYPLAAQWTEKAAQRIGYTPQLCLSLASTHALLGEMEQAGARLKDLLDQAPAATVKTIKTPPFRNPDDTERFREGLRKAGLPVGDNHRS